MRLNAVERESFRKHLEIFCAKNPNVKSSETVNHFKKEGIARNTTYDNFSRLDIGHFFIKSALVVRHCGLEKSKSDLRDLSTMERRSQLKIIGT